MKGKVVVITGANRGIGAAAVDAFVKAGARVAALSRTPSGVQGEAVLPLSCDVADWDQVNGTESPFAL